MLVAGETNRKYNLKCQRAVQLRNKGISKTVIKNKEYFATANKFKQQKKSHMVQYQEKVSLLFTFQKY